MGLTAEQVKRRRKKGNNVSLRISRCVSGVWTCSPVLLPVSIMSAEEEGVCVKLRP